MTNATAAQPALRVSGVTFGYSVQRDVVRDILLDIMPGDFIGIAGPNGAGKSTLLLLMTGYLRAKRGAVLLNGRDVMTLKRRQIAQQIAFAPQKPDASFSFSVEEMVMMGRHPYAGLSVIDSEADYEISRQALEDVGIRELAQESFSELSGGEQQLVIVARALAQQTPILVLDEPISFLDPRHAWHVLELLRKKQQEGCAVIATFHDLNAAAGWCSRLVLMRNGSIVADGRPAEVLTSAYLDKTYDFKLGVEQSPDGHPRVVLPAPK